MSENLPIMQKRGCGREMLDNCILIKAPVDCVSAVISEYFDLEQKTNYSLEDWDRFWQEEKQWREGKAEANRQKRKRKTRKRFYPFPLWRYTGHPWTVWPLGGQIDAIAYILAALLNTYAITFQKSKYIAVSFFKVYRGDKLVERYDYGIECGNWDNQSWDIDIDCERQGFAFLNAETHHFRRSIRQVNRVKMQKLLGNRQDDKGFLDACLRYYNAYIPSWGETIYYRFSDFDLDDDSGGWEIEQMDAIAIPNNWSYRDSSTPRIVV